MILSTAIERTIEIDAIVNAVTIETCVTITSPRLSSIGIMSAKTLSVIIGVRSGINPAIKLAAKTCR